MTGRPSIESELREGALALDQAGILNPKREATAIWASLAGVQMGDVWLTKESEAPQDLSSRFSKAVAQRARGEPLPYVVGVTGFRKIELKVDRRALIPRPETEGLVELVLEWGLSRSTSGGTHWGIAADVGTGTGCIALSLALEGNFERIIATDKSLHALELASENVDSVRPPTPVDLIGCSLLDPLDSQVVDVVVSNPPYVTEGEYRALDLAVRDFEPRGALVSGADGLSHTRALLRSAKSRLTPGGLVAIEVDSTRADAVVRLAEKLGWSDVRIEVDLFGRPRFILANKEM